MAECIPFQIQAPPTLLTVQRKARAAVEFGNTFSYTHALPSAGYL